MRKVREWKEGKINMIGEVILILILALAALIIWDTVWKLIAAWYAARNNQVGFFIALLIFNTLGIFPMIYLLFFQKNKNKRRVENDKEKTKRNSRSYAI